MSSYLIYILYTSIYGALFSLNEVVAKKGRVSAEISRKLIHVLGGVVATTLPVLTQSIMLVAILTGQYALILYFSKKRNLLRSIHAVSRLTAGAELFPLAVFLCFCVSVYFNDHTLHILPLLILSISDALAALVGARTPIYRYLCFDSEKSIGGSLAFFISSFLISFVVLHAQDGGVNIYQILILSGVATVAENVGRRGTDNIFIPLSAVACLFL